MTPGVGLAFRPELGGELLASPGTVDLVEVIADGCFGNDRHRREVQALAERWPVIPHGVKLSLGSASGIDRERARKLGQLARQLRSPFITEHVAFTNVSGRELGHLTPLPLTLAAVNVVAHNVAAARRELPDIPLFLENIAWTLRWPDDALDEGSFYHEIVARTGCRLLLDLGNVYANAYNRSIDPLELLLSYPLDHVGMIHLAGGGLLDGFYMDTHAHPLPAAVLALLNAALERCGPVPIIIERDARFPPFADIAKEVQAARAVLNQASIESPAQAPSQGAPLTSAASPSDTARRETLPAKNLTEEQELHKAQTALGSLLLAPEPASCLAFDPAAIARTKQVLRRKRFGDAVGLLTYLQNHKDALWPLADAALSAAPRPARATAIADAFLIAERALAASEFAKPARHDLLLLRSHYVVHADGPRPRSGPFVGRIAMPDGSKLWAYKGLGTAAAAYLYPSTVAAECDVTKQQALRPPEASPSSQ